VAKKENAPPTSARRCVGRLCPYLRGIAAAWPRTEINTVPRLAPRWSRSFSKISQISGTKQQHILRDLALPALGRGM